MKKRILTDFRPDLSNKTNHSPQNVQPVGIVDYGVAPFYSEDNMTKPTVFWFCLVRT